MQRNKPNAYSVLSKRIDELESRIKKIENSMNNEIDPDDCLMDVFKRRIDEEKIEAEKSLIRRMETQKILDNF